MEQLPTAERSDVKRNVAQISQVATRPTSAVSPKGNPTASFFEVAAQVSAGPPRGINVPDSKRLSAEKKAEKNFNLWANSKMGFGDFVDIINPLQHIPIVATIYRNKDGHNSAESPPNSSMIHSVASPAMFEASDAMESAFGDFDDDGGFFVAGRASRAAQSLALRSTSTGLAALNSYGQNIDLDESKEPFRFRFPA